MASLDTSPAAAALQCDLYRRMTPADKARRVTALTQAASRLSLAGLRLRYPQADERELWLRLAVVRLGAPLVARAYGEAAPGDGA